MELKEPVLKSTVLYSSMFCYEPATEYVTEGESESNPDIMNDPTLFDRVTRAGFDAAELQILFELCEKEQYSHNEECVDALLRCDAWRHKIYATRKENPEFWVADDGDGDTLLDRAVELHLRPAKRYIEPMAEEFPEYLRYSETSTLYNKIFMQGEIQYLIALIEMGFAPSVAENYEGYLERAIREESPVMAISLARSRHDLKKILASLRDDYKMISRGINLYRHLKDNPDCIEKRRKLLGKP